MRDNVGSLFYPQINYIDAKTTRGITSLALPPRALLVVTVGALYDLFEKTGMVVDTWVVLVQRDLCQLHYKLHRDQWRKELVNYGIVNIIFAGVAVLLNDEQTKE